jgi:hypothetical protein
MIGKGETLYIAVVEHKHGTDFYASGDQEKVLAAVEEYCKWWWEREGVPGEPDADIVSRYFNHVEHESYCIDETELL